MGEQQTRRAKMAPISIEHIATSDLTHWATNARTHSKKQIRQIADSIRTFGFTNPVLIDEHRTILAGHGRVAAAILLGMKDVPCLRLDHMSAQEKRAYVLADNKLALNAGWDEDLLAAELGALMADDLDFDIGVIGFSIPEIDGLLANVAPEEPDDPADDILPVDAPRRVKAGDVWQLGSHRLVCGDALDPDVVGGLMAGEVATMVFSDPPYNVKIDGHVGNSGKIQHREFAMASGEMSQSEFTAFLTTALRNLADHSIDGSIHFLCMDWRHMGEMLAAGQGVYTELKNLIVWAKDNGGMGTFYRSRHELIFVFKNGAAPHINTFELGQHGRYRTNVWQYRGVNTMRAGRMEELALHPTVKPVQMISDAIRDVSGRGDIVLDLFGGSGSTLIASEKTGRRGYLCELDPIYCDRTIARWEAYAKDDAEQVVCGWNGVSAMREAAE
ncbi:site-specific DNA-methyltransferase [Loktanella sp. DJP18]|uniref:site-specific DNA-methyltransferase n=1 Tax=Loktanella sp. DJP18 TaxID=3409788 RepID=UPI003BB53AAA